MQFSIEYFLLCFKKLLPYLPVTLMILISVLVISIPFSMFLTWRYLKGTKVEKSSILLFIKILRGSPFIVLLFLVYFGIPKFCLNVFNLDISNWSKNFYIIFTMVIYESARMIETMRSAYLAVSPGQIEAAVSCGLTPAQGFFHIVFPQAIFFSLPNMSNLVLTALLETSLGFSIGIIDFVGNARLVNSREYGLHVMEIYMAVALTYWVLSMLSAKLFDLLEGYLGKKQGIKVYLKTMKEGA